jgi:hypothetical protein
MAQEDKYESLEHLNNDFEYVVHLQNNIISRATGKDFDSKNYKFIREKFLTDTHTKNLLPDFIRTCRDIEQFWQFIKVKFSDKGCYDQRRSFILESFQDILSYLEEKKLSNGSSLIKLAKVEKVLTIDQELNILIEEAKERFKNPNDKKIALEKLWDAFERIKTYFGTNKKLSSVQLVKLISTSFDENFIDNEFKELTSIGNNYNIRHHEQDKIIISENKHIEYLFFRMLALLNLCVENIHEIEGK